MCVVDVVDVADEEDVRELAGGRGQGGGAVEEVGRQAGGASREIRGLRAPLHALPTPLLLSLLFLLHVHPLSLPLPSPPLSPVPDLPACLPVTPQPVL